MSAAASNPEHGEQVLSEHEEARVRIRAKIDSMQVRLRKIYAPYSVRCAKPGIEDLRQQSTKLFENLQKNPEQMMLAESNCRVEDRKVIQSIEGLLTREAVRTKKGPRRE